jgi:hypothetical protein
VTTAQEGSIKEVLNKMAALEALQQLSNQILQRTEQKYATQIYYQWGSIKIKIIVFNKDAVYPQQVPVKSYLPQEVKIEDVLEKGDFEVFYDAEKQLYYAELPITPTDKRPLLLPGGSASYELTLKDVWIIEDSEIEGRKDKSDKYLKQLEDKKSYEDGKKLYDYIGQGLDKMVVLQKKAGTIPVEEYISNYRTNLETRTLVDNYLERMRKLIFPELAEGESPFTLTLPSGLGSLKGAPGILGAGAGEGEGDKTLGITRESAWKLILIIMTFLGLLSVVFFLIWQSHLKKARVSPEFNISPESVQMPEMGKSEDIGRT